MDRKEIINNHYNNYEEDNRFTKDRRKYSRVF